MDAVGGGGGGSLSNNNNDPLWITALSQTMGISVHDGSFWEESISADEIRQTLMTDDPQNPTPATLKAMKWLLAAISKGKDVSDFYVGVVQRVATPDLTLRKMVYIYLMHYANHVQTQELSLLSINSFQRGLADAEPALRALALRVLTAALPQPGVRPLQRLAVQKHAQRDASEVVRAAATLALAQLHQRGRAQQGRGGENDDDDDDGSLEAVLQHVLDFEHSPMVLSAALMAFYDVYYCSPHNTSSSKRQQTPRPCPLHRLHGSYRKLCHLLADLDEYGQVVALDVLLRYVRTFFCEPPREAVRETDRAPTLSSSSSKRSPPPPTIPTGTTTTTTRPQRRVVKKAFYSDEEDDSTEEEEEKATSFFSNQRKEKDIPLITTTTTTPEGARTTTARFNDTEYEDDLDPDHRLLLRAARPLLKSRNAAVVLAVCTLHFYGGGPRRHHCEMARALVRLHRSHRPHRPELQYVVLTAIRQLVAVADFAPADFFWSDVDPPGTRLLLLDILTALAEQSAAHRAAVLDELRHYVGVTAAVGDRVLGAAALRAVGRIALGDDDDAVALHCLAGLDAWSRTAVADQEDTVGAAVGVMQGILYRLWPRRAQLDDPHGIWELAFSRIVGLLFYTLDCVADFDEDKEDVDEEEEENPAACALVLPPEATAAALWLVGECWSSLLEEANGSSSSSNNISQLRLEGMRLVARAYTRLDPPEKEQAIHLATKLWVYTKSTTTPVEVLLPLCEHVLALGRLDPIPDVRDRARMESTLLHLAVGLQYDREGLEVELLSSSAATAKKLSLSDMQRIFLGRKPDASYVPWKNATNDALVDGNDNHNFRFGTLSSLVGHDARGAYLPFPPWAEKNSDSSLRDPPTRPTNASSTKKSTGYDDASTSSSDSEDDDDDDSSSSSDSSSDESSSSSESSTEEVEEGREVRSGVGANIFMPSPAPVRFTESESDDSSSATSSSSSSSSPQVTGKDHLVNPSIWNTSLIPLTGGMDSNVTNKKMAVSGTASTSVMDDMRGLVLIPTTQPVVTESTDSNFERDSGAWISLLRPEHASGLLVEGRYLRSTTKAQQAQVMGFLPEKPTLVIMQLRLENQKTTIGSIRHIRLLQRAFSTSNASVIGPRKMVLPPPIDELPSHRKTECLIGIEFLSSSDRDGSLLAKLDIKFGSNSTAAIDIKPSIGDLLLPCQRSVAEFDSVVQGMQGFSRATANFVLPPSVARSQIPARILSRAALSVVPNSSNTSASDTTAPDWDPEHQIRWVGTLPHSADPIYVISRCIDGAQQGTLVVCCDHALVANSFVNLLKRAISE